MDRLKVQPNAIEIFWNQENLLEPSEVFQIMKNLSKSVKVLSTLEIIERFYSHLSRFYPPNIIRHSSQWPIVDFSPAIELDRTAIRSMNSFTHEHFP